MIFPETLKLISLPFLFLGAPLFFCGVFFVAFCRYLPPRRIGKRGYLLFGFTSLSAALFSLTGAMAYSSLDPKWIYFWSCLQFFFSIPLIVFFIQFSAFHLDLDIFYFRWIFPIFSFAFSPFFFLPGGMMKEEVINNPYYLWGHEFLQPLVPMGPVGLIYVLWTLVNSFVIGFFWLRYIRHHPGESSLMAGFFIFVAAGIYDLGVTFELYQGPHIFIFGFGGMLIAMGFQLFRNVMEVNQAYQIKSSELQKVNEEMRFLVGTISHDIMGPLVSIHGFTDLLQETDIQSINQRNRYLERIRVNADHMKALLSDLATFVRVGRIEEVNQKMDMKNIIHQALAMLDIPGQFPKARIEVSGEWPPFIGSPKHMKQVLMNFVQNSLKYAKRDDVVVILKGETVKNGILFCVSDNGPGIPPNLHEKVFETFFRNDLGTPGTGMGLSIVKKIVESVGGRVWVDSQYKDGARFCVTIPFQQKAAVLAAGPTGSQSIL